MDPNKSLSREVIEPLRKEAFELADRRHREGKKEYGAYSMMDNPLPTNIKEEIVDAMNYLSYLYAKITIIERVMKGETSGNMPSASGT